VTSNDTGDAATGHKQPQELPGSELSHFHTGSVTINGTLNSGHQKPIIFSSSPVNWLMARVTEKAELSGFKYCLHCGSGNAHLCVFNTSSQDCNYRDCN